ncbi:Protein of unknown function [Tenacibaculum sp. MAR_2009_124]|uniref:DUF3667 domain-containing protein n=1 Tax=Tenacibaculum sp. MAR_2009_124 TaxID=1250059 RepID=UPI0008953720|nr:DUF3667 domain-containing protein [Tenacibaculum sp. MAR_2009_124]SEB97953.1 Protein of unknown function [Tenacibaculum sp. MAR_2009_124]
MIKKNKALTVKDPNCLNCGHPFTGHEKYCPECGQENKGSKITFANFMTEMFRGFFSWDAKFWRTLFPLLISPGKVSYNYISGKRNHYSNPFRFYLTVSIMFFLLLSVNETYKKINKLNTAGQNKQQSFNINLDTDKIDKDSLTQAIIHDIQNQKYIDLPEDAEKNIQDSLKKTDSIVKNTKDDINFFTGSKYINKLTMYNKVNPDISPDEALKNLELPLNFSNRFWYSRAVKINKIAKDKDELNNFLKQMISMGSISLFVLLPLLSLSLKFIYIRRKYTYVEHLVFVFHVQTVFFILLTIFLIISMVSSAEIEDISIIFFCLFAIYLYLAMKKFYKQGYFKTFFKYIIANFFFMILTVLGISLISAIAFAIY